MEIKFKSEIDVTEVMQCGSDLIIAAAAWVSTNGEEALAKATEEGNEQEKIGGLINYLMKHRHGTPFEHGSLTIFVRAPIFVWREWHRHRIGFSYNEESARYKQLDSVFYLPPKDRPMFCVEKWTPGRPKFLTINEYEDVWMEKYPTDTPGNSENEYDQLCAKLAESYAFSYKIYEENLANNFDSGLARDCLPVGIYSSCWVTMNPRSIMSFLSLRTHDPEAKFVSYPLYEIEQAARKVEEIFAKYWPITYKAFCDNGRVAP